VEIHDDDHDRLIDMLLREELSGERPPQMAERIVKRATEERTRSWRPRLTPAWVAVAVAAAMIAFVLLPRFFSSPPVENIAESEPPKPALTPVKKDEPAPQETEDEDEPEPLPPAPVAEKIIRTEKQERIVELGGYCRVTVAPFSVIENKGEGAKQHIALKQGGVACEVDSKKGKFTVEHPMGTVHVTGTKFRVTVVRKDEQVRRVTVGVKEGRVVFDAPFGEMELTQGQEGGSLLGTVVGRGKETVEIRADGDEKTIKYVPRWVGEHGGGFDRRMLERLGDLKPGMRVKLAWKFEEHYRVLGFERLPDERPHQKDPEKKADAPKRDGEKPRDGERRRDGPRDAEKVPPRRDGEKADADRKEPIQRDPPKERRDAPREEE